MKGSSSVRSQAGWTAGVFALLAVGCTAIAGVEDPEQDTQAARAGTDPAPGNEATKPTNGQPTASTSSASTSAAHDAGTDASPSQTQCTVPANQTCSKDSDCGGCGRCNEDGRCATSCKKQWDGCDLGSGAAPCCKGLFCSTSSVYPTCQPCLGGGSQVTSSDPRACCSGQTTTQGMKVYCK